jgi:hypothetical protein
VTPPLYLAFPTSSGDALVCRVIAWDPTPMRGNATEPCPLVAMEVPGHPDAYDRPHLLDLQTVRESVVSHDPEVARAVITTRLIAAWADQEDDAA